MIGINELWIEYGLWIMDWIWIGFGFNISELNGYGLDLELELSPSGTSDHTTLLAILCDFITL